MTISTEETRKEYNCDGSTQSFSYDLPYYDKDHVVVVLVQISNQAETVLVLDTDYTLSEPSMSGGTVNTVLQYSSAYRLVIYLDVEYKQETDLVAGGALPADAVEKQFDLIVQMVQQLAERIGRAPLLPVASLLDNLNLPIPSANAYLGWNSAGNGIENKTPSSSALALSTYGEALVQLTQKTYFVDPTVTDQGAVTTEGNRSIADLVAIAGSNLVKLVLPHSGAGVTTSYVFDTSYSLASKSNVYIELEPGAIFDRTTGDEFLTVAYPENILASPRQKITSVDMLRFNGCGIIYTSWWGMGPDSSSSINSASFQYAVNSAQTPKCPIILPAGNIYCSSSVTITYPLEIIGVGINQTSLIADGNFSSILTYGSGNQNTPQVLRDLTISTTGTTTQCVNIGEQTASLTKLLFERCKFSGDLNGVLFYTSGILVEINECAFATGSSSTVGLQFDRNNQNSTVHHSLFFGSGKGVQIIDGGVGQTCEGIRIEHNVMACTGAYQIELNGSAAWTYIRNNIIDQSPTGANYIHILDGSTYTTIQGNYIGGASGSTGTAIRIEASSGDTHIISKNTIANCGLGISVAASGSDVVNELSIDGNIFLSVSSCSVSLDSVSEAIIVNNRDKSNPSLGSWNTFATVANGSYKFANNIWHTTAPNSFDSSASYTFSNDKGIVGHAYGKGTTSGAATSLVVTHGLFTTPSVVLFSLDSGGSTPGASWVNTIGATQFTVTWANSLQTDVHWQAFV